MVNHIRATGHLRVTPGASLPNLSARFQPIGVKVAVRFPACCSTSAAGAQEQPVWQWADLQHLWRSALSRISQLAHPERGVHVGVTLTPLDRHPRKHRARRGCSIPVEAFGSNGSGRISSLECRKFRSGLFVPVAALRVAIWHQTRASSAAACQKNAGQVSATRRGGITFSLSAFWKCELVSFPCRKVLTILHQPFFNILSFVLVLTRAHLAPLCVISDLQSHYARLFALRQCFAFSSCKFVTH